MYIRPKDPNQRASIVTALQEALKISRFTAVVYEQSHHKHREVIRIEEVRLRNKKDYCGQHPGPCQVTFIQKKHRTGRLLEGLDWAAFIDELNNICDKLDIDAQIWSYNREASGGKFLIRLGRKRRVCYDEFVEFSGYREFHFWIAKGDPMDYEDWCGKKAPPSRFPDGTPGIYQFLMEAELEAVVHGD